jgi:hypothetical protein
MSAILLTRQGSVIVNVRITGLLGFWKPIISLSAGYLVV